MSASSPAAGERPYRSHLQPACLACRRRKSRCKVNTPAPLLCLMCQAHGTDCVFPDPAPTTGEAARAGRKPRRRRQTSAANSPAPSALAPPPRGRETTPPAAFPARTDSAAEVPFPRPAAVIAGGRDDSHVVGPVQSPDAQLIANYLQNDQAGGMPGSQLVPGNRPILFNAIRRHPLGYTGTQSVAAQKCEVIENLVGPFCCQLIDLYFTRVHKSFPLLDEASFRGQHVTQKSSISPALLACLYAHALPYWRMSKGPELHFQCPNLRYTWNQANEALYSELHLSPGISTVIAILLNISGRPLTTMIGNAVLLSSAISLAHSLGLNRACLDWDISPSEKYLRVRLWWALVVYDKWSSAAYGTPPHLRATQHDVPIPSPDTILGPATYHGTREATLVFVGLITLTGVLDRYLDCVFDLQPWNNTLTSAASLDIEVKLAQWEDSLSPDLRRRIVRGVDLIVPGSNNLRLGYLYLQLLGRKLGIDTEEGDQDADPGILTHRHVLARKSAESIVLFVQELDDYGLEDFWMSSNAFALSSTMAFLLRNALEKEDYQAGPAVSVSLRLASDMMAALKAHQRKGWDLANICISQYSEVVENLAMPTAQTEESIPALQQFLTAEGVGVDDMFPSIWEMLNSA